MSIVNRPLQVHLDDLKNILPTSLTLEELMTLFYTVLAMYGIKEEVALRVFSSCILNLPDTYTEFGEKVRFFMADVDGETIQ